jgi:hypothetical protein
LLRALYSASILVGGSCANNFVVADNDRKGDG